MRGNSYRQLGQYTKAIEVMPNNAENYYYRGYAYLELKKYKKAEEDIKKALNLYQKILPSNHSFIQDLKEMIKKIEEKV